ncbi:monocarboxylic acid transporter silnoon [Oratosquilla oratoria]|uniref:monocarboxylic acid transporter silnoon n=1 Tax=Oratosquilla oratoria TaxID=337810 RepID=UPI003F763D14
MTVEKVVSSPALVNTEEWNRDGDLRDSSLAGDLEASPSAKELDRHSICDFSDIPPPPFTVLCQASTSNSKLQPVTEASENSGTSSVDDVSTSSKNKVASFYIGDDQGLSSPPVVMSPGAVGVSGIAESVSLKGAEEPLHSNSLPLPSHEGDPHYPLQPSSRKVVITASSQGEKEQKGQPCEFTPPDGGYGWVVALAACIVNMWIVGFIKSYGVLYMGIRQAFPGTSAYVASWCPALLATTGLIIAPVTGALCRKFTSRKVSFIGGLFCCLGLLLGSQATSMVYLIFTLGLFTGIGAGLTTTPGVLIVSLYFERRRALASAICVSGNALGGFFMPPLIEYLLEAYGLRSTMVMLAGMQLHICAASCLYRPIRLHALIQAKDRAKHGLQHRICPEPENSKLLFRDEEAYDDTRGLTNVSSRGQFGFPQVPSAPTTPLARSQSLWKKMVRTKLPSSSTCYEDEELQRQISFLRSSSMMNSIPDLTQYARSWSISGSRRSLTRIPSNIDSKPYLMRLPSTSCSSKPSLTRHPSVSGSRPSLHRRMSGGSRPSLHRHPSGEETRPTLQRMSSVGSKTSLPPRLSQPYSSGSKPSLVRLASIRRAAGKMSSLPEMDATSLDQVNLLPTSPDAQDPRTEIPAFLKDEKALDLPKEDQAYPQQPPEEPSQLDRQEEAKEPEKGEEEEEEEEEAKEKNATGCITCCLRFFNFSLFKSPLFVVTIISVFLMAAGAPHAIFFLPAYASSRDIESSQVTLMLSISSIVDLFGRLGIGLIADLRLVRNSVMYAVCALTSGLAVLSIPWTTTFSAMTTMAGFYGFGVGAWFVLIPTLLAQHHGSAQLASSYGLVRMFHGFMNFISPQINGMLADTTGTFGTCYFYMGACMVAASFVMFLEPVVVAVAARKEEEEESEDSRSQSAV